MALAGLVRRLVSEKLLDSAQAEAAISSASNAKVSLVSLLVQTKTLDSRPIARAAAEEFGVPLLDLSAFDLHHCPKSLIDPRLIRKHHALPLFKRANKLYLAVSDPGNIAALDEIKFHTGIVVEAVVVDEEKLAAIIPRFLDKLESSSNNPLAIHQADLAEINVEIVNPEHVDEATGPIDDAPLVKFINRLLVDAVKQGASDIHIEPYESSCRIRYRIDGLLREIAHPPVNISTRIASRVKIMSHMDIAERRLPQDGRIKVKFSRSRAIDFRVNTLPTLWGEKIVLRILDPSSIRLGIDILGFDESQKSLFLNALNRPQGMILVTGPTGSGKTVTLYSALNILNAPHRNISTAEDPVEINQPGINQVQVNKRTGLDFATALRAFLRQDPDIIMVGEIRDLLTAEIAIKAAQTGHLVLSTLHTNSAAETLSRLRNMGVPAFNLATAATLIIAQRLARRLCNNCKEIVTLPEKLLINAGFQQCPPQLFRPVGCDHCSDGYKGRIGIYEVVPITDSISSIIIGDANAQQIAEQAQKEGFRNLRQSALSKVEQGVISLDEANRLT